MKIRETRTSRERQFLELINKHCPDIVQLYSENNGRQYGVWKAWKPLRYFLYGSNPKFYVESQLIGDGTWGNIDITVYDPKYLNIVMAISEDYERETGYKVTLFKEF